MTTPRRDPHLGDLAAAFADDALDLPTRDRALIHLAHCPDCRAEVDAHRQVKAQLAALPFPPCPGGLLDVLRALPDTPSGDGDGGSGPSPRPEVGFRDPAGALGARLVSPARIPVPGPPSPVAAVAVALVARGRRPAPRRRRPTGRPNTPGPSRIRSRRRLAVSAAGGVAVFALTLTTVVVLGGEPQRPPRVAPPVSTFVTEHSRVTGGVTGSDPETGVLDVVETGR